MEGSHLLHESFWDKHPHALKDWRKIEEKELEHYEMCPERRIACTKGDMVLWDSRTVHYAKQGKDRLRCVIYICMQPARLASKKDIEKKRQAFLNGRMTTHWPCKPVLFPKNPRTWGDDSIITRFPVKTDMPQLNDTCRKLAGLIPY